MLLLGGQTPHQQSKANEYSDKKVGDDKPNWAENPFAHAL
jgi:hypothetical protein